MLAFREIVEADVLDDDVAHALAGTGHEVRAVVAALAVGAAAPAGTAERVGCLPAHGVRPELVRRRVGKRRDGRECAERFGEDALKACKQVSTLLVDKWESLAVKRRELREELFPMET